MLINHCQDRTTNLILSEAYLLPDSLISVAFMRVFSFGTTHFSAVDAVRSCMMGPMLQIARKDAASSPALAKEPNRHLGSDTLL